MTSFPEEAVEGSVADRFETVVREHAGRPAIVFEGVACSYAELNARANRLARRLRRDGSGGGGPTPVLLGHGADEIATILACLKAGGAYVALDPSAPVPRLEATTRKLGAERIVSNERHGSVARKLAGEVIDIEASSADLPA